MRRIVRLASFATTRFQPTSHRIGAVVRPPSLAGPIAAGPRTAGPHRRARIARPRWLSTTDVSASRRRRRATETIPLQTANDAASRVSGTTSCGMPPPPPPDHHHDFHGPHHGPPDARDLSGTMQQTVDDIKTMLTPAQLQLWNELVGEPVTFELHHSPDSAFLW